MEPLEPPSKELTDSEIKNQALKLAKLQAFKNLYLKDIRHHPEKYLDGVNLDDYERLADSASTQKEMKHSPVSIITYNAPHVADAELLKFYNSLRKHIFSWKWVTGYYYAVELAPGTDRPHLHMVLQQSSKRYPSEIHRQIWTLAHNAYHTKRFPFVNAPGHNRQHLDVRPVLDGQLGVGKAVNYLYLDEVVLARGGCKDHEWLDQCYDKYQEYLAKKEAKKNAKK